MKASTTLLALCLALLTGSAYAQTVVKIPIAERIARRQNREQRLTLALAENKKKLADKGLDVSTDIKGIMQQTEALHNQWYTGLLAVSNVVRGYRRVIDIYEIQKAMLTQAPSSITRLRNTLLSPDQLNEAGKVYMTILNENIGLIEELVNVLAAGKAKMTDAERIVFIDDIANRMEEQLHLMNYATAKFQALGEQLAQRVRDQETLNVFMTPDR